MRGGHENTLSIKIVMPDLCCIVTQRLVESVGEVFDPIISSDIAVFEQMWCVDWLRTATVYTKQTTGVAAPSPVQSSPTSRVSASDSSCMQR